MKKLAFIFSIGLFSFKVHSQTVQISGSLIDSLSRSGLAYGNVIVKNQKDSIVTSVLTNEKGEFKIKNLAWKKGMYLLTNYLGYNEKTINFSVKDNTKISVGNIFLIPGVTQIKEATINGKTKYMEQKFDRKVFNISEAKTTAAKDIFDLLRTLPGVTVDEAENVKFKGAPATIYVDDQPAEYVYPKTSMIPVVSVLKIELIDASLRNGAGKGGIINIKMKNLATDGFSGAAQADNSSVNFKDLNSSEDYINANYKIKKVLFFDNFNNNSSYSNSSSNNDASLNHNSNSFSVNFTESDKNTNKSLMNYGGVRFTPNKDTRIRLSGGFYNNHGSYPSEEYYLQNDNFSNTVFEQHNHIGTSDYSYLGKWLNGSFYHCFDSIGKEMTFWAGLQDQSNNETDLNTYNYQYVSSVPFDSTFSNKTKSDGKRPLVYGGFYYNNPINSKTRWNCGWNGYGVYKGYDSNIYSQGEIVSLPLTSFNDFSQMSQTIYFRIGTTVKKWKFDVGASGQYDKNNVDFTRYKVNSDDTLLRVNKGFFNFLPSATIVFSPDSLQEIKLTYSKSVQSSWYTQLCDFIDKTNPFNWSVGNSLLVPTAYTNFYLGYSYNKETWNINTDVFYSITNNDVSYLTVPVTDVITITTPENIAHNSNIGVEFSSWLSLKQKYDLNFSSAINHTSIRASDLNGADLKRKDFGYNFKFSADIRLSAKTTGTFYINYFSREVTFSGYNFDYFNSSLSLTHKFFANKLLLTLGVNNIFDNLLKHGDYYDYAGIIINSIKKSSSYLPAYFLTLQYKFRQGDRGTKDAGKAMKTGK